MDVQPDHAQRDAATSNGSLVENFKSRDRAGRHHAGDHDQAAAGEHALREHPDLAASRSCREHVWKSHVADLKNYRNMDFPVVGYGPFVLAGNKTNQYATMKANKDFFLGAPQLRQGGHQLLLQQRRRGRRAHERSARPDRRAHPGAVQRAVRAAQNIETYQQQSSGWTAIEVNSGAKTRSGQADGHGQPDPRGHQGPAGDRARHQPAELVTKILDGNGVVGRRLPAARLPAVLLEAVRRPERSTTTRRRPSRSSTQAGYKKGAERRPGRRQTASRWSSAWASTPTTPTDAAIAPYLQEWMTAIGIELDVSAMSFDQLNDNLAKGDWDMLMDGWSTGPDPTYLLSHPDLCHPAAGRRHGGNTDAFFCNKQYDKLFDAAGQTQFDPAQRAATIDADAGDPLRRPTPT